MNRKAAFTLIELLLAMAAGSTIMVLSIGLVHRTILLSSSARYQTNHYRSLDRLSLAFRDDVHRATSCDLVSTELVRLHMTDGTTVNYQTQGNVVILEQPLIDSKIRREVFQMLDGSRILFGRLDSPDRATVTVHRQDLRIKSEILVDRRTEAVIGRRMLLESGQVDR